MRNGKTRRPQFLTTDEVSPSVDLVGCYQFHSDTEFFYRLPSHHLILIESGRIEARTATNRFEAKAGDLVCFRPAEINEYGTRGPTLFYQAHIQFAPPPRHRYTPWLNSFGSLPERLTLGNAFESMRRVFETWCIELGEEGEAHQLRVRAAVFEALAIIADVCARKSPSPTRLDDWQRVRMRLRSELAAEIKIEQLARQLGVSTDHFIRQFKHRFGMTPKAYHNQARLAEAARLLRSTDHPAKAIGFNVGFSDPKAFARAFKRHFGVAPSNLRLGNDPLPRRNEIAKGGLFAMNKHILPPHAGPDYTMKWRAQKVKPGMNIVQLWYPKGGSQYWFTRFWIQRSLAFIYLIAFLIAANQYVPLVGEHGLLPVRLFLKQIHFGDAPSLFFLNCSDVFITITIWCGLVLSVIALAGISDVFGMTISVTVWALLWFLYLSLVNVGQVFYGFGWEMLLLETGFLAIFLGPTKSNPPTVIFWLVLWVLFRIMFGAGMIKLRGDDCWGDLTCLFYHHETQPLPNPLSWYLHHLPKSMLKAGVLFNHFVELIVPWFLFAPRRLRHVAGGFTILFQVTLILSGNLSWLNYITIVLCIACFDDMFLSRLTPSFILSRLPSKGARPTTLSLPHATVVGLLTLLVVLLSIQPVLNLFSRQQSMNASFNPLHLVNTYGAFGSITKQRYEIILEGTDSDRPDENAVWKEYEFKGKPGDVHRRPCVVSPYHWKLDWQMWFAAMSPYQYHPWILNLVAKLLAGDKNVLSLMANNPFPDAPPKFIRAELYLHHFTDSREDGTWWRRQHVVNYLPTVSLNDPEFRRVLKQQGWLE